MIDHAEALRYVLDRAERDAPTVSVLPGDLRAVLGELTRLRRKSAQWEMATLAAIASGLDATTASWVQSRIQELAKPDPPGSGEDSDRDPPR